MRHLLIAVALSFAFVACSTDAGVFVEDLSTGSQISLCNAFLDNYCDADPSLCADACIDTGCQPAAEMGDIDAECGGILDTEVEDCGIFADDASCSAGADCMIDALEAACSGI